jgi:hypothetical protein
MPESGQGHITPSSLDGDGVRIIRERPPVHWRSRFLKVLALTLIGTWIGYLAYQSPLLSTKAAPAVGAVGAAASSVEIPDRGEAPLKVEMAKPDPAPVRSPATQANAQSAPADWRTGDANDIATYVSPTDPEPTAAELIQALRDSGDHGGIAAFNPPGTSPPLQGLAVPEDFALPDGYVRHHQVTDDGEPIEAILMFSPDYVFRDATGAVIPIPEDRVVPPDMAPPGLPLRQIEIPPPPQ